MADFLKAKFDNISLFFAMLLLATMILHIIHHGDNPTALSWAEQTFTTVLGAYIGLIQAHRLVTGGSNGSSKNGNGGGSPAPSGNTGTGTNNPAPVNPAVVAHT